MFSIPQMFEFNIKTDFFQMWQLVYFKNHKYNIKIPAVKIISLEEKRKQLGSWLLDYNTHTRIT